MRPKFQPAHLLAASLLTAGPLIAGQAQAAGLCTFDEIALRLPAGQPIDGSVGHDDPPQAEPFVFAYAKFAMHSGGVRMDSPHVDGAPRYVSLSSEADNRFTWAGNVFAMPRADIATTDGRRMLLVRRADAPVVDLWLGHCQEDDFDRDAFEEEFFHAVSEPPAR